MQRWMNQGTTMRFNDIKKDIECCRKYGFDAIELKYNLVHNYERECLRDLLEKNKICIGSIGALHLPILQGKEVKCQMERRLYTFCQCAYDLGADYIVVIPPREVTGVEWGKIEEDSVKILNEYSDIAAGYQIKIAMEVMGFSDSCVNTIERGLRVIRQAEKSNLGLIYDFYHVLGMEDLGKTVLNAESKEIFIVHVNDGMKCETGIYQDDNRLWPGDGNVDIPRQIDMLKNIGYQGPFSIEVYQSQIWPYGIQECYRIAQDRMKVIEQYVTAV